MLVNDLYRAGEVPEPSRRLHIGDWEWLNALYPSLDTHPDWWLEFRFLEEPSHRDKRVPPVVQAFLQQPEQAVKLLETHRQRSAQRAQHLLAGLVDGPRPYALFYGVQPRSSREGRKQHVAALVVLVCDLDFKDWREVPEPERPLRCWAHLHTHAPKPSLVTLTGHGMHVYWLLSEPLHDTRRGEALQKAMARRLRGDHIHDCNRLLRWPHTVNYKGVLEGATPTVRVIWFHPEIRYAWEDLEGQFCSLTVATVRAVEPTGTTRLVWKGFHACVDQDSDLKALWEGGPTGLSTHDRSTLDMALAHALVRHRFGQAAFDIVAGQAPWNADKPLEPAYLKTTWRKAQRVSEAEPAARLTTEPKATEAVGGPPLHPIHSAATGNPSFPGLTLPELPGSAWTDWACLYRNAVGPSTEAADAFHYVTLLTIIGAVLGRSVMVFCGRPVYANIYAMLIGPTGDRKSTAAELALALLPQVAPEVLVLNGVGSQEGLMERMAGVDVAPGMQRRTLLYIDEVASLLKKSRRESSGSLLEFVTEVFGCPDFKTHTTRSKGIHLERPTLSILACSTPTWLEAALEQEDILGGFANRFVYVTAPPKTDNPLPSAPDAEALSSLTRWIRRVAHQPPRQLVLNPAARSLWSDFYVEWRQTISQLGDNASALLRRTDLYILKIAALAAAMEDANDITPTHLRAAIDLGRFLAGCTLDILGHLGAPRDCRLEAIIERKLAAANGQMRRKQLRQALSGRITGEKLDRMLGAMCSTSTTFEDQRQLFLRFSFSSPVDLYHWVESSPGHVQHYHSSAQAYASMPPTWSRVGLLGMHVEVRVAPGVEVSPRPKRSVASEGPRPRAGVA